MTFSSKILALFVALTVLGCDNSAHSIDPDKILKPLIAKGTAFINEQKNTLLVFVGEKVDFRPLTNAEGSGDNGVKAKYKILQLIYGNYSKETIEFKAYDHYELPDFLNYKNVLLFLSEYKGKYYQEKYMYNDVYKTKDGRWAGCYAIEDYNHDFNKTTPIKPIKIDFIKKISYPTKIERADGVKMQRIYPSPYFKTIRDSAFAVYGNYVEDRFKLKKDGFLTARELFGDKKLVVKDVEIEEVQDTTKKKSSVKR